MVNTNYYHLTYYQVSGVIVDAIVCNDIQILLYGNKLLYNIVQRKRLSTKLSRQVAQYMIVHYNIYYVIHKICV